MSDAPVIGKNLPYVDVAGKTMLVEHFTQMSSYRDGVVKSNSATVPHGLLKVSLDGFDESPILPIGHTIDYKNACELWEIVKNNEDDYSLWVEIVPVKGLLMRLIAWSQPRLLFNLMKRGASGFIETRRGLLRGDEACRRCWKD